MRQMDTQAYVGVLKELVENGHEVSLKVEGWSMSPFLIHRRDTVYFRRPHRKLRRGDVVFYRRATGQYVMHRICRIRREGFYLVGDAQQEIEGPLEESQIFALITAVERKGKRIGPRDPWWLFFAGPWLWLIPLRRRILNAYGKLLRKGRKEPIHGNEKEE